MKKLKFEKKTQDEESEKANISPSKSEDEELQGKLSDLKVSKN